MGKNPSNYTGVVNPVERVSWSEAIEFCNLLSTVSGLEKCYTVSGTGVTCDFNKNGYRLSTEAEWEYAAKGGGKSKGYKYSGSNDINEIAWYRENSGYNIYNAHPHSVKTKKPNELGLYDMSGNVWEWCWDLYSSSGSDRVARGGSWHGDAGGCSVSYRYYFGPSYARAYLGFRLARSAQD